MMLPPIFDGHFHLVDPAFPLIVNNGYLPPPFTAAQYREQTAALDITGGTVVSGSFQGYDQRYLMAALEVLGPGFVGVANIRADVTDAELHRLAAAGVRGVRFNLYRGGSEGPDALLGLGRRAWDTAGIHTELYVDAADLEELEPTLRSLPRVGIDHLGMTDRGRTSLLRLVEHGVRVKATGFGRVDLDVASTLVQIDAANPTALIFGTDLPSTRARRPFRIEDVALITSALGPDAADRVLHDNGMDFYRLPTGTGA